METLGKGDYVFALVEEALDDMAVVSIDLGTRTLRGVLLDTDKRLKVYLIRMQAFVSVSRV